MGFERISAREHDLGGGFIVRRLLPHTKRRSIGPFVFFDHMGPHQFAPGEGIDVRPHPHIGLSTLTWLWDGALSHRDSLGSVQVIKPGDVNWMTAGSGIVHSERTPAQQRESGYLIEGIQTWLALPEAAEEMSPAFEHQPASAIPVIEKNGMRLTIVAGHAFGERSPVSVYSDTLYVSIDMAAGASVLIDDQHLERAVYLVDGDVTIGIDNVPLRELLVLPQTGDIKLTARASSRLMLLGGAPLGDRFIWWNFVARSRERIEQAKLDWQQGRFAAVPGETEFIPLP